MTAEPRVRLPLFGPTAASALARGGQLSPLVTTRRPRRGLVAQIPRTVPRRSPERLRRHAEADLAPRARLGQTPRVTLRRLRGLTRLIFDAVDGTTRLVERTHRRTAERVARALGAMRAVARGIDLVIELPFEALQAAHVELPERALATPMDSRAPRTVAWWLDAVEGFVAGAVGDRLAARDSPLAPDMTRRREGRAVPLDCDALRASHPDGTGHVVVFVHGLSSTEWASTLSAREHWGDPRMTYGMALRRDRGVTPLYASATGRCRPLSGPRIPVRPQIGAPLAVAGALFDRYGFV